MHVTSGAAQPGPQLASAPAWFAVRTKSNHERLAADTLVKKGVEAYVPTITTPSRRSDRAVSLQKPLFGGYFFVRTALASAERIVIMRTAGVVQLVGFSAGPLPVPEWQLSSIREVLARRNPFEVLWRLHAGRRVRVVSGPFEGIQGVVVEGDGIRRLAISIEILGRSVLVQIDHCDVEPLM